MTGIHPVHVYRHTAQGAPTAQVHATCRNPKKRHGVGQKPKLALFPESHSFSVKGECRKLLPESSKSVSGSRCGRASMSTQGAEFVKVWKKKAPIWASDPDATTKLQVQSLPTFALCWRLARSEAHQVSGKRQTPMPLLTAPCSTKRRSSTVSPVIWKCKHGKARLGTRLVKYGERYHCRFSWLRMHWTFLFLEPSTNLTYLRMALFPINFSVCVATGRLWPTRKHELWESPGNRLINHTHMKESEHLVTLAQEFGNRSSFVCPRFVAT